MQQCGGAMDFDFCVARLRLFSIGGLSGARARVVPDEPQHHKVQLCNPQHSTQSNWRRSSSDFDRF